MKYIIDHYKDIVRIFGKNAAVSALEFYNAVRDQSDVSSVFEAGIYEPDDGGLLEWDVRQAIESSKTPESTIKNLSDRSIERIMTYVDETIRENAYRDPARPRWALVPHAGACGWCRILGSNGFVYANEKRAKSQRHPNCVCSVVVDFSEDPSLKGYDPDALYSEYADARQKASEGAWDAWMALTDEERDKYKRDGRSAFDVFLRNRIAAAMPK